MANDLEYIVAAGDEIHKIRELLRRRLKLSSRLLRKLKYGDGVTLNGAPVKLNCKAVMGDRLGIEFPKEVSHFVPEAIPVEVLYEDEDLLIINKQAGLVVHPTKGHPAHTLANGIMNYMLEQGREFKIRFINRLDMDTTGVLLIGKNAFSQDDFFRQSAEGGVVKKYIAVVEGIVEEDEGTVDLPIDLENEGAVKRVVREDGFPSLTHYRTLARFPGTDNPRMNGRFKSEGELAAGLLDNPRRKDGFSMLELRLATGRTHQIRVHLAHLGHPVVGDVLYGRAALWLIGRQALHAAELDFVHPRTRERMEICAPLPPDMEVLLGNLAAAQVPGLGQRTFSPTPECTPNVVMERIVK